MKKAFACMLILMMIFSFSCVKKAEEVVFEPIPTVEATPEPTKKTTIVISEPIMFESFSQFVEDESIPYIIIGKVEKTETAERNRVVTRSTVEVNEILKNKGETLQVGDRIYLDQTGGETDDSICIDETYPLLKKGSTYLLFVWEEETNHKQNYFQYCPNMLDGYAEIIDGKLYKAAPFYHLEEGMELSLAKDKIMSVVDGTYAEKYRREDLIRRAEKEGQRFDWYFEPEDYTEEDRERIYYGDYEGAEGY